MLSDTDITPGMPFSRKAHDLFSQIFALRGLRSRNWKAGGPVKYKTIDETFGNPRDHSSMRRYDEFYTPSGERPLPSFAQCIGDLHQTVRFELSHHVMKLDKKALDTATQQHIASLHQVIKTYRELPDYVRIKQQTPVDITERISDIWGALKQSPLADENASIPLRLGKSTHEAPNKEGLGLYLLAYEISLSGQMDTKRMPFQLTQYLRDNAGTTNQILSYMQRKVAHDPCARKAYEIGCSIVYPQAIAHIRKHQHALQLANLLDWEDSPDANRAAATLLSHAGCSPYPEAAPNAGEAAMILTSLYGRIKDEANTETTRRALLSVASYCEAQPQERTSLLINPMQSVALHKALDTVECIASGEEHIAHSAGLMRAMFPCREPSYQLRNHRISQRYR